jgi:hypothetical protein
MKALGVAKIGVSSGSVAAAKIGMAENRWQ